MEAALAETKSKKALAEALAIEIPPRHGDRSHSDVTDALTEARQDIIDAGGEEKASENTVRLSPQRHDGSLVLDSDSPVNGKLEFGWVQDASLTAHTAARNSGMSIAEFTAEPKTTRQLRMENGVASKDGDPVGIVKGWSDEQRITAAKELHHDPCGGFLVEY